MKTPEDSQQLMVEAIQSDIPTNVIQSALGITFAKLDSVCNAREGLTVDQFKRLNVLMREYNVEGW